MSIANRAFFESGLPVPEELDPQHELTLPMVGYAKAFIVISDMIDNNQGAASIEVAKAMVDWLEDAGAALEDDEIAEMAQIMDSYATVLSDTFG